MSVRLLSGRECQCMECLECFVSLAAFDAHRIGDFAGPGTFRGTRTCQTPEQMQSAGWAREGGGQWRTPPEEGLGSRGKAGQREGGATPVAGSPSEGWNRGKTDAGRKPEGA